MTSQNDGIAIILSGRCYLYTLLQNIFSCEPSLKLLEITTSEHIKEVLDLFSDGCGDVPALFLSADGGSDRADTGN